MNSRAKFVISKVEKYRSKDFNSDTIEAYPVCPQNFGPNGEHLDEDMSFFRWSPSGHLSLTITNPALLDQFEEGKKDFIDISEAEETQTP